MNHAITHSANTINAAADTHPVAWPGAEYKGSLLEQIVSRLAKMAKTIYVKDNSTPQYRSFMDENLLDPVVGPEISRTLRR
jgi:hypothetical protein